MQNNRVSFSELFKVWSKVAAHSFGGPAGQIAVIHKLVVEDKKLISEERFLHALNFCMLLPGPEAQQLATYMGWLMRGAWGGLIAGGLFILPGFLSILALSYLYVIYLELPLVQGLFYGMKPAIIAIVVGALLKISKKSLKNTFAWSIAFLAFISLFVFNLPFPLVVGLAGLAGVIYGKISAGQNPDISLTQESNLPSTTQTLKTVMTWSFIWVLPIILLVLIFGYESNFVKLSLFFSKMSMVTFGGAYAALSYVAQQAVENYGWLQGSEMLDGLGMAETTPGPLIQVVQFVGFMGSFRFPDISNPYLSAFLGSVLTTWMTFAPCFLWIFTGAPYVEYIRGKRIFSDILSAITAAVVGVIFNLSLWFSLKVLFSKSQKLDLGFHSMEFPVLNSFDGPALLILVVACILQFVFKRGIFTILGISTLGGILVTYFIK